MSELKPLSTIAEVISGFAFKSEWFSSGQDRVIRISDLVDQQISLDKATTFDGSKYKVPERFKILKGDILVALSGATTGKIGVASKEIEGAYVNQRVAIVRGFTEINSAYLTYILQSSLVKQIIDSAGGAAQPNMSPSLIEALHIPIPDEMEQYEIASKLKEGFDEVIKARLASLRTKQDLLSISIKQQRRTLEILNDLPRVPLSDYLEGIEAGKSIQTTELPAKKDEIGVLKVSAVSWDRFQPDEAKSVFGGYNPPAAHRIKKGDLIISRANTLELVGAIVLVEQDYPNRLLSDKTLRLKLKPDEILSEYLLYILKLPEARKHIEENATGTSNSMRNISQKAICTIPIPKADETQQKKIIELMQGTRTEVKKGEEALKLILADLDRLPKILLEQAFN